MDVKVFKCTTNGIRGHIKISSKRVKENITHYRIIKVNCCLIGIWYERWLRLNLIQCGDVLKKCLKFLIDVSI